LSVIIVVLLTALGLWAICANNVWTHFNVFIYESLFVHNSKYTPSLEL